ncbi:MAG: Wzz/FepE/Etk N-terminal domain-containing protein [Trueperaceae bacterium]|nr:Wzz/FepE/Etk N-terminal domain-containing protein [Trueperaceae bacterium]
MAEPDRAQGVPSAPPPASDEISLRELYLVLRRRAVWIVLAALVAGGIAAAVMALRPSVYVAEASAVVARTPVSVAGESGLQFRPELDVTFETYSTLAFSRGVLEEVLEAVPKAGLTLGQARSALTLERLAGSANQPSSLLAVAHRAQGSDGTVAAALATRWAAATIGTVRALLTENLDSVETITGRELIASRAALDAAETALVAYREANEAEADPLRLESLRERSAILAARGDELTRMIGSREAELASLQARGDATATVVLNDAPDVVLSVAGAVWALEAQVAGNRAELAQLAAQQTALHEEIARSSAVVARVETTVAGLERAVLRADAEVAALAAIEPTVAYVAQLAPAGARVLSDAAVPAMPEGRSTLLVALLAAVVVGFAGVVVALLAEAVRDPAA